jgi:UDP-glucose 4-epimerase
MILVTGGLGFIGLSTARSLIDLDETCVLTRFHVARDPEFMSDEFGKRAFIEQLDVTDAGAFSALGDKYDIDGIIHLAVPGMGALGPFDDFRTNMNGLVNAMQAAKDWGVKRITIASSIAVYGGISEIPYTEDMRMPLVGTNPTEAFKKSYEILSGHIADRAGIESVSMRISGIYGPLYHSMANLPSRLVHAAVHGTDPDFSRGTPYAGDGSDMCYVKDCGRGIALLQTAASLNHRVYNVAAGFPTTAGDLVNAVHKVIPDANLDIPEGHAPGSPGNVPWLDITRLRADTGYEPGFNTETAIADYVGWLRAGNEQ